MLAIITAIAAVILSTSTANVAPVTAPIPPHCVSAYHGQPGEDSTVVRCSPDFPADSRVLAGCVSAYHGMPGEDPTVVDCSHRTEIAYPVAEDTGNDHAHPDMVARCLLDLGYTGRPDDHREAIYAPSSVITSCRNG